MLKIDVKSLQQYPMALYWAMAIPLIKLYMDDLMFCMLSFHPPGFMFHDKLWWGLILLVCLGENLFTPTRVFGTKLPAFQL